MFHRNLFDFVVLSAVMLITPVCLVSLQAPFSLHTDPQTLSSRSPSGSVTSTAASTPSSTRAPTRSLRRLSRVYSEFIVWERSRDHTIIIWAQFSVKLRVTASPSIWAWTAGGLPVGSALPPPWPCPEPRPPGTAGSGESFLETPQADLGQPRRAGRKWPNSAVKAFTKPAAASSVVGPPRRSQTAPSPLLSETFPPLKSTNCPCRKKESLYNYCNPSSISHDSCFKVVDENIFHFALLTSQRMSCVGTMAALKFKM